MADLIYITIPRQRVRDGLACVAVSGLLAGAAFGLAPPANATCASFFGLGNSAECTSTLFSVAFAIGNGATAHADGVLGASFAIGTAAAATSSGALTLASAVGNNVTADAQGLFGTALSLGGDGNNVQAGAAGSIFTVAANILGSNNNVSALGGFSNRAINIGGVIRTPLENRPVTHNQHPRRRV